MATVFPDEPNEEERAKDKALKKFYNPFKQFNIRFIGHEQPLKEDIQKTFQECFPWHLGKTDKKKGKKEREENAKNFFCELYGWNKDNVGVEEIGEMKYSVKVYCDYFVFEMKVEE